MTADQKQKQAERDLAFVEAQCIIMDTFGSGEHRVPIKTTAKKETPDNE